MDIRNLKQVKSLKDKIFGMLLKENQRGLVIRTRFGIHTLLMKFPVDVYILDKNQNAVKVKKDLKPNRFFFWNPKYTLVIELPSQR